MNNSEILIYHSHTEESNRTGNDYVIDNHFANYAELVAQLPENIDPVFVRTEHVKKRSFDDPKSFHQQPNGGHNMSFAEEIESRGGQVENEEYTSHITGTLGENRFAMIDGVEANYHRADSHMLLCGLDRETEIDAWEI